MGHFAVYMDLPYCGDGARQWGCESAYFYYLGHAVHGHGHWIELLRFHVGSEHAFLDLSRAAIFDRQDTPDHQTTQPPSNDI